jgi:hypothetical protein
LRRGSGGATCLISSTVSPGKSATSFVPPYWLMAITAMMTRTNAANPPPMPKIQASGAPLPDEDADE